MPQKDDLQARRRAIYEADWNPDYSRTAYPNPDARLANAAEYIAFQMGQINKKMDRLIAALEAKK